MWQAEEENFKMWCNTYQIPLIVALSKADKLNQSARQKQYDAFLKASTLPCFLISNTKGQGIKDIEDYIYIDPLRNNQDLINSKIKWINERNFTKF